MNDSGEVSQEDFRKDVIKQTLRTLLNQGWYSRWNGRVKLLGKEVSKKNRKKTLGR